MENKKEINDESLKELSGGNTIAIDCLNIGDCFIDKLSRSSIKQKIYIAKNYPTLNIAMAIEYRKCDFLGRLDDHTYSMSLSEILDYYEYSPEDSNPLIFG